MKKFSLLSTILMIALVAITSTSCVSRKKLVYFQGADTLFTHAQKITQMYEMRLKPADQVLVKATCSDPELLEVFSSDVTLGTSGTNSNMNSGVSGSMGNVYGFTVTNDGNLVLPALGKVHVDNMTTEEAARAIEAKIKELNIIKDPEVTVRLLNARVTVIGAAKSPKVVSLTSERNTIIDILAQCSDLDVSSLRSNVKLFREINGERVMYDIDLTKVDIFDSPAYYVQQNDMIYIEPNKSLGVKSSAFYTFLSAGASILGLVSSIAALALTITNVSKK